MEHRPGTPVLGEGKRDITDIDCLRGEGASRTRMYTLDASGLVVKEALISDDPFSLPNLKAPSIT